MNFLTEYCKSTNSPTPEEGGLGPRDGRLVDVHAVLLPESDAAERGKADLLERRVPDEEEHGRRGVHLCVSSLRFNVKP